ncbi:hypothetical protein [Salinigranum halophilum]|uniref:hypothetical protein n=1 Tax=Salinigranum halophilum TaxID=2565931 RepID=UPI0010A93144|nr:hypothetical protein [Salinigranum halophilum]
MTLSENCLLVTVMLVVAAGTSGLVAADTPNLSIRINGDSVSTGDRLVVNLNPDFMFEASSEDGIDRIILRVNGEDQRSFSSSKKSFKLQLDDNSENQVKVILRDTSGDVTSTQFTVVKDRVAPFIGFESPFESQVGSRPPESVTVTRSNLTFVGALEEITSVQTMQIERRHRYTRAGDTRVKRWATQLQNPGSTFSSDVFLGIGENTVQVLMVDKFGNSRAYAIEFTVRDRTPPDLNLGELPSETRQGSLMISGVATDNVQVDEVTYSAGGGGSTSIISSEGIPANPERQSMKFEHRVQLVPGRNKVTVTATDVAGETTTVTKEVVYNDTVVPRMRITNASLDGDSVRVNGSVEYGSFRRVSIETVAVDGGETLDLDELYAGEGTSERVQVAQRLTAAENQSTKIVLRAVDANGDRHVNSVTVSPENPVVERFDSQSMETTPSENTPGDQSDVTDSSSGTSETATSEDTLSPEADSTDEATGGTQSGGSSGESEPIRVPGFGVGHAVVALLAATLFVVGRINR